MNPVQARQLIQDTFSQVFDKARFRDFAINLLNHVDEDKKASMAVPDAFSAHVKSCQRLATYASPQGELLDVLIVHLMEDYKIERTRTALRDFVAHKLKRGDNYKEAALVAFVPPDAGGWRLSYVRMQYESVRDPRTGVIKPEERLTPARRFSYIVGEGESCHTAQTRFLGLLQDTEADPTLADIQEAFSVEAVTKEFYKKYRALYEVIEKQLKTLLTRDKTIRDEFTDKGISTVDFAKKLMGQIVFLYFLQKKGWLGVARGEDWGAGPRDFLRKLANGEYGRYGNFFNDALEPLFYDTLATDRGHEAWCKRFKCRIPFLNGGLFEPLGNYGWRKTDILLSDKLFTNTESVEEGITGTGVLDVFDRYNFTVNEAEPLEKEVAIDPEMLGKVFENLIEENQRKGLGAYYTPREIVHYMCQESLINYLDTALNNDKQTVPRVEIETFVHLGDQAAFYEAARLSGTKSYEPRLPKSIERHAKLMDEKLADITVCDPAVGSGAFPVGMMMEIVRARCALTPYFNDFHERTPYHFKRHAIQNCLYGVDIDAGAVEIAKLRLWLSLVVDEEETKQIKPLPNLDFKIVTGNSLIGFPLNLKSERLQEVERLKLQFFDESDHYVKAKLKHRIDDTIREAFTASKASLGYEVTFDIGLYFSEVFDGKKGFDVVIANPPYVRQERIKELKLALKQQYRCYDATADIYVYFYERAVQLIRQGGGLAFITSNKYFRSSYGRKLRGFLSGQTTLRHVIDFGDAPVFEAISYPSIVILTKNPAPENSTRVMTWKPGPNVEDFVREYRTNSFHIAQSELTADGWRLEAPAVLRLLEKLRASGKPLREYVGTRVYRGITTGLNEAFVVDGATRERLIAEDRSSAGVIKLFLRGRDVDRWLTAVQDQWLLFTRRGVNIEQFPAIKRHLSQFKRQLAPGVVGGRKPGPYEWYEIQDNIAYWQEFEKPKIISTKVSIRPTFAIDTTNCYLGNTAYFFPATSDADYLLALLNSCVFHTYARKVFVEKQNGWFEIQPEGVESFPIPAASTDTRRKLEALVDRNPCGEETGSRGGHGGMGAGDRPAGL